MHEEQRAQELELADGEVGRIHTLAPLLADDAHTDVARLDHRHIVGAIADGEAAAARHGVLDEVEHLRLLVFACAAGYHRLARVPDRRERLGHERAAVLDCLLIDYQAVIEGRLLGGRRLGHAREHVVDVLAKLRPQLEQTRILGVERGRVPSDDLAPSGGARLRLLALLRGQHERARAPRPPARDTRGRGERLISLVKLQQLALAFEQVLSPHGGKHRVFVGRDLEHLGRPRQDLTRARDVDGRAHLVAGEHPDLDARGAQVGEELRHTLLELVLDGRGALKDQGRLELGLRARDLVGQPLLHLGDLVG